MKNTAIDYHQQRLGNCAQSVVYAWNLKTQDSRASEEDFAGYGGGRAPGGLCGALHASCALAGAEAETIQQSFAENTGGVLTCREIRMSRNLSCSECVGLAAELLEKHAPMKKQGC
jgi:hypothetical protein